jgi:putative peptidoglycan lipid II flippase
VRGPPEAASGGAGADRVGRTSLLLVPVALASRGAAFVVPVVVALWFGVGEVTDAWFWALAFPTFALVLASTSLGTAATPALARARAAHPARLPHILGGLLTTAGGASLAFGLAICLAAGPTLPLLTDFDPPTAAMAQGFLWRLLPFMVLTTCGAVMRVACEVHGRFLQVALSPVARAATVILVTWALLPALHHDALPWGLVAGEVVQLLLWTLVLWRQDGILPKPGLHLDPEVAQVGRDLAPILGGEVLVALNLVVDKAFAATLSAGSVATLEYADRARVIPQTLLESTLLMVAYAHWSHLFARGEVGQARRGVARSLAWVASLASPVLAGMFIGRQVLVATLFERGAFLPADTAATASVLGWYLPGVLPNLLGILAVRAHVVERNLRLVLVLGVGSLALNTTKNAALIGPLGLQGLALSTTLVMVVIPGLYLALLARSWGPSTLRRPPAGVATPVASVLASTAVAVAVELGPGAPTGWGDPTLWGAAVACFTILGLGWRLTRSDATR